MYSRVNTPHRSMHDPPDCIISAKKQMGTQNSREFRILPSSQSLPGSATVTIESNAALNSCHKA